MDGCMYTQKHSGRFNNSEGRAFLQYGWMYEHPETRRRYPIAIDYLVPSIWMDILNIQKQTTI
jgi:hypothetical protein